MAFPTIQLRKRDLLLPLLVFLIGSSILFSIIRRSDQSEQEQMRTKAELNAVSYADRMMKDLDRGITITESLKQILISENGTIDRFPKVAADMMSDCLQSIQLAPDGVVTDIYPEAGNEAGKIDLIHDEKRGPVCRYGRDNNLTVLQGPFPLNQGGNGIAIRNPVFLEDDSGISRFWGFTIAIIRVPEIYAASVQSLTEFGYAYKLSKTPSPLTDDYQELNSSGPPLTDPVVYAFELGGCSWKLEVMPLGGWDTHAYLSGTLLVGSLIVLLWTGLTYALIVLRRNARQLKTLSTTDPLTSLLNRNGFDEQVDHYLKTHPQESCVCAALDIDNFKFINDLYGHSTGDRVLRQLADEMRADLPPDAILGRNGGDEFCVLLPDCTCQNAEPSIQRFTARTRTFSEHGKAYPFSISLGYTACRAGDTSRSTLLRNADMALYEVKLHGKHGCLPYTGNLQPQKRSRLGFTLGDIAQNLPGAFLIYRADPSDDRILFANNEMVHLAGCVDLDDFLHFTDQRFHNLIVPEEQSSVEQSIWKQITAKTDGSNDYVRFHLVRKDGTQKLLLDHGRLVETSYYGNIFYVNLMDCDLIQTHFL